MFIATITGKVCNIKSETSSKGTKYTTCGIYDSIKPRGSDEWQSRFFNVTAFGVLADSLAKAEKGQSFVVVGRAETRVTKDKDGNPAVGIYVTATELSRITEGSSGAAPAKEAEPAVQETTPQKRRTNPFPDDDEY